jgi:hypothetical protein
MGISGHRTAEDLVLHSSPHAPAGLDGIDGESVAQEGGELLGETIMF